MLKNQSFNNTDNNKSSKSHLQKQKNDFYNPWHLTIFMSHQNSDITGPSITIFDLIHINILEHTKDKKWHIS
jgi:hypothetical protein